MDKKLAIPIINDSDSQAILLVPELSCFVEKNYRIHLPKYVQQYWSWCIAAKRYPVNAQAAKVLKLLQFQYVDFLNEKDESLCVNLRAVCQTSIKCYGVLYLRMK